MTMTRWQRTYRTELVFGGYRYRRGWYGSEYFTVLIAVWGYFWPDRLRETLPPSAARKPYRNPRWSTTTLN